MAEQDGRVAIITGASRGIGKQLAVELGRRGFRVVVAARTVEAHRRLPGTIADTVAEVEAVGGQALAVRTDVTVPADLEALVAAAVEAFGGIDVVVNNAADTSGSAPPIAELAFEDWRRQIDANLHGPFLLMRAAVPELVKRGGGVIVNLTSGAGDLTPPEEPGAAAAPSVVRFGERLAYAASKAGLNRLANAVAPELRAQGIAVVNVDPGFTRTELVDLMGEKGMVDADAAVPMEVPVKTIVHLVTTDEAMAHTGQVVRAAAFVAERNL